MPSFPRCLTLGTALLLSGSVAFAAQEQPAVPGAAQANLQITITTVEGLAQVRQADDQPWAPAKVGMTLEKGAEFRTGPRSMVRFQVGDTQTVTLDRLGTVKVLEAIRQGNQVKTQVGMKYGRTHLQVEAGGLEHQSSIRSPSATLAVRGSGGFLTDDGMGPATGSSTDGTIDFGNTDGEDVSLPDGSEAEGDDDSPAEDSLDDGTFHDMELGSDEIENDLDGDFSGGGDDADDTGADEIKDTDDSTRIPTGGNPPQ